MSDSTALCKRNKDRTVFCIFCASSRVLVKKSWLILTLVKSVKKLAWNMHHEDRTEISDLFSFFERTRRTGVLSFFLCFFAGTVWCATDGRRLFFSLKTGCSFCIPLSIYMKLARASYFGFPHGIRVLRIVWTRSATVRFGPERLSFFLLPATRFGVAVTE